MATGAFEGRCWMTERRDATAATKAMNDKLLEELPFEDRRDFEEAERGFIAPLPGGGVIRGEDGSEVWNAEKFSFIEESSPAPDTVNPSLWRQSQLVLKGGLFKVIWTDLPEDELKKLREVFAV
jgi:alkyl sulfatase BDS1-like metallo-beta-lactamase superfamily hydrolase